MSQHSNQASHETETIGFIESLYTSIFIPGNLPSQMFLLINGSLILLVVLVFVFMLMGYSNSIHVLILFLLATGLFLSVQWVILQLPKDVSLNSTKETSTQTPKSNKKEE